MKIPIPRHKVTEKSFTFKFYTNLNRAFFKRKQIAITITCRTYTADFNVSHLTTLNARKTQIWPAFML
jgi:hypothetical protein